MQTPAFVATKKARTWKLFQGLIWVAAVIAACLCPKLAFGQTNSTWNAGSGNWSTAADWTPNQVPNNGGGNTHNVTIGSNGGVVLDINATINSLALEGFFSIDSPATLNITGALAVNSGNVGMCYSGDGLTVGGNASNSGFMDFFCTGSSGATGTMTVGGTLTNQAGAQLRNDDQGTNIGSLTVNASALNNAGLIADYGANSTLTLQIKNGATNTGTLESIAPGAMLVLSGGTYNNTGGTIQADLASSSVQITGATVTGGTLNVATLTSTIDLNSATINEATLTGKGTFVSSGSTMIGGKNASTLQVMNGSSLTLAGLITNAGKIEFGAGGGTTKLLISGDATVVGGTISMSNNANNVIEGASTGNEVLTNEGTIEGSGNIGNGFMGLVNTRTIVANQSTPLTIDTSSAGFSNNSGTKNGTLQVNQNDTLNIIGPFSNFSGTTLTGGIYSVAGTLEFTGADIVTNAASITLTGTGSKILNSSDSADALANSFAVNSSKGSFTLAGNRNFTTPGNFSNAGKMTISAGSTFTVGGTNNYKQTAGSTIVSGTLAVTSPGGVNVSGGSVFGIGTITGNIDLTGGLLSPGAASKKAGELTVKGTYAQSGAGAFDVDLGGTTAGTQYDVLNITSTAMLGGVLNVDLISGFTPVAGDTFTIMDYSSEMGTFSTTHLPTVTGDHWTVTYNATDVVLTLVAGPVPPAGASPSAKGPVNGSPATRVSRNTGAPRVSAHEPVAILSRVSCFGARLLKSASCGSASVATVGNGGEMHAAIFAGSGSVAIHNNIMVATRSLSAGRGSSHETSASATAMIRLYVCAYLPSSVAHTMGCN